MLDFLVLISILFMLYIGYTQIYPYVRKNQNYKQEREQLVKQYNRTHRARNDMLVSAHSNRLAWVPTINMPDISHSLLNYIDSLRLGNRARRPT